MEFESVSKIDSNILRLIPIDFAIKNFVLPLDIIDGKLRIAMINIRDYELISRIKFICKMEIEPVQVKKTKLQEMIASANNIVEMEFALEGLKKSLPINSDTKERLVHSSDNIKNAPAVKLLDYIVNNAIRLSASDIHFEPNSHTVRIRYRIDGSLVNSQEIPLEVYSNISTRIKILSKMDISEKRVPQDGKWQHEFDEKLMDLRVASLPTLYGEKFVIRILDKSMELCDLNKIYTDVQERILLGKILTHNHGIILATGPTGSGKSTTLYAMLKRLNNMGINITTIEDPIEFTMDGINQVNVNIKSGINFASGLRSILRQDPDVIMIGEIRDEETASIAIRAAITGHLVLSTLHTNDAVGAINRLIDMGVEKYLIQDSLVAVISQRLVKRICNHCKISYLPSTYEQKVLNIKEDIKLNRGVGCKQCHNTGYLGRIAVSEILYIDKSKKFKFSDIYENTILIDKCKKIVIEGITTIDEMSKISNGKIDFIGDIHEKVSL